MSADGNSVEVSGVSADGNSVEVSVCECRW